MQAIRQFLTEVRDELGSVKFPDRQDTLKLTTVVLSVSFVVGIYIGGLDYLLTKVIARFLQ